LLLVFRTHFSENQAVLDDDILVAENTGAVSDHTMLLLLKLLINRIFHERL